MSPQGPRAEVGAAMALFARATAYLPRTPRLGNAEGYRVFWVSDGELRWRDVVADERCHVVLGRHPAVDVRLGGDPAVALRHLVLRARKIPEGAVELRVLDLGVPTPLLIDASEEPAPSSAVTGPLIARLGAHPICALPYDGCQETDEDGGPGAADRDDDREGRDDLDDLPPERASIPHRPTSSGDEWSRSEVRTITASARIESLDSLGAVPWVELRLVGERGKIRVNLAREQLDGMVLVGRYDRCIAGARPVFSDRVSRVHLGLVRRGDAVEVLDLGSTNGIERDGRRVRRVLVRDHAAVEVGRAGELVEIAMSR